MKKLSAVKTVEMCHAMRATAIRISGIKDNEKYGPLGHNLYFDYNIEDTKELVSGVLHLTYHPCNWHPDSPFRAHSVFCLAIAQDGTGELTTHEPGDCRHLRYDWQLTY